MNRMADNCSMNSQIKFNSKLVYILSDTPDYVRASKNIPLFVTFFREVHFIGCSRGKNWDSSRAVKGVHYHVEDRTLAHGASSITGALCFLRYIRNKLVEIKPEVVIATNEEYILPFTIGYFRRPDFLICDLIDSLGIRMMGPLRHLNPFWSLLSVLAKRTMNGMVEVNTQRLSRHLIKPDHCTVIYNSPEWKEVEPIKNIPYRSIYVCGSTLDRLSGIETLLEAADQIPDLYIVFAGRLVGPWLNNVFVNHPKVINLGETTPEHALRIGRSCRAIFAHYKPFIPNYVYAAPNKLFDAMMLGVPLLINSECKASEMAIEFGFGIATPFGDAISLKNSIENLLDFKPISPDQLKHVRNVFRSKFSWEIMKNNWEAFFVKMGIT